MDPLAVIIAGSAKIEAEKKKKEKKELKRKFEKKKKRTKEELTVYIVKGRKTRKGPWKLSSSRTLCR